MTEQVPSKALSTEKQIDKELAELYKKEREAASGLIKETSYEIRQKINELELLRDWWNNEG